MGIKDHGYYGYAFVGARPLQFVSLVTVLGLVANFISLIARVKQKAPQELVATLVITCISVLWTLLSFTAYHDSHIPYIVTAVIDLLFLVPFIVIAVVLGQPLSYTTCSELPKHAKQNSYLAVPLTTKNNGAVSYVFFVGGEQTTCYEIMAVWGLMIALCVLFAISAIAAGFLFLGKRRATAAAAAEADFEMAPKAWSDSASFPPPPSESGSFVPPMHSRPATPAGGPRYDAQGLGAPRRGGLGSSSNFAGTGPATTLSSSSSLPYPPSLPDTDRPLRAPPAARLARRTSSQTSLGTRTMVHVNDTLVSGNGGGFDDSNRGTIPIALSTTPLSPPPPVAAPYPESPVAATTTKRSRFQEVRRSLWPIPAGSPLPPENPAIEVVPPTPSLPAERTLARSKTKRKTILERIEGWWDLGLVRMDTVRGRKQPFPSSRREKHGEDDAAALV